MRARAEAFGAWVRVDDPPALVAVDRALASRLGVDGAAAWGAEAPPPRPLEAHVAVTARCPVACTGCYQDATPDGVAPSFDELVARFDALAREGVFVVALGGGEPLSRDDLPALARAARERGLAPVMTTSGVGLTAARARTLTDFAQVNVSFDGDGDAYRAVRGFDGAALAARAMNALHAAGVPFGVNLVLTRRTFGAVEGTVGRARELGAAEVQLLRFKPAGRGVGAVYLDARLTQAQVAEIPALLERLVRASGLRVRIDCSMVPFLCGRFDAATLEAAGVLGCEAGRWLASVDVLGRRGPCSFYRGEEPGPVAARWAGHASRPPRPCDDCALLAVCRGGCRVVAEHLGDGGDPDPECPRVVAWRARG
ncbi:MAG: radical SAM protein [Polyangiaceae bacterium]|nr:radical SAM protein [Polyangiaceae bacterium]